MVSGQVLGTLVSINVVTYTSQCWGISVHISYKAGSDVIYQARKMWEIALLSLFIHTIHKISIVLPDRLLNSGQEWCMICPRYLSTYENLYEWNLPNTDTQKKSDQQRFFSQFKIALWHVFCVRLLSYARYKRDLKATRSHYDYCQGSYEKEV